MVAMLPGRVCYIDVTSLVQKSMLKESCRLAFQIAMKQETAVAELMKKCIGGDGEPGGQPINIFNI